MKFEQIVCGIVGHRYAVERVLSQSTRKVACARCDRKWAMNDDVRCLLPWDQDFENFYKEFECLTQKESKGYAPYPLKA